MPIKNKLITTALLFSLHSNLQSQSTKDIDSIAGHLITNLRSKNSEKILLQTDRSVYYAGETIWFKALPVNALNNTLTNRAKILFVDLVDNKDSVKNRLILNAGKFLTDGAFVLRDSLHAGNYWLRAYDQNILDDGFEYVALLPVYVIHPKNMPGQDAGINMKVAKTSTLPHISIFPEGGAIISGYNSTVALQVDNYDESQIPVSGIVKDQRDTVVAKFSTNNKGSAKFTFMPKRLSRYKIYIQNNNKYDSVATLPMINLHAAQLSVVEQNDQFIKVRVLLEDSIFTPDYTTYLLGTSKDSLCFAGVGKGNYELNIPVAGFPGGIASLVLYNTKKQLVSERNVYINKEDAKVTISIDKQNYAAREYVKLSVTTADNEGKPLLAALSISVIDDRYADSTYNYFKDSIENYSFPDADLDMLIYSNKNLQPNSDTNTKPVTPAILKDPFIVSGTVYNSKKVPVQKQEVVLLAEGTAFFLQDTTDAYGRFSFKLPEHDDSSKFNLQVNSLSGEKMQYDIVTDPVLFTNFSMSRLPKPKAKADITKLLSRIEQNPADTFLLGNDKKRLKPVVINTSVKTKTNSNTITHDMLQKGGFNNIGDAILRSGKMHLVGGFLMAGAPNRFGPSATDEPTVVVDGVQVGLPEGGSIEYSPVLAYLKTLSTNEIDYIKVLTGAEGGGYGVRGGHGVIEIHTTAKSFASAGVDGYLKSIYPQGFHVPPPFEMPDYKNKQIRIAGYPDMRKTIYWNGDIITDNNGKATINFFTADTPATYLVTISGITENGLKIFKTTTISRK